MSGHEERPDWFGGPWIESVTRYRWFLERAGLPERIVDVGAGAGAGIFGAIEALAGEHNWWPAELVVIDGDADSLATAVRTAAEVAQRCDRPVPACRPVVVDLAAPGPLLDRALDEAAGAVCAFEVVEHLSDPGPLLAGLARSGAAGRPTALSVPHDAFFRPLNDYHVVTPSPATVHEYAALLGADWHLEHQYRVTGTVIGSPVAPVLPALLATSREDAVVASHFLLHAHLGREPDSGAVLGIAGADEAGRHAWAVQRELDLAYWRAAAGGDAE